MESSSDLGDKYSTQVSSEDMIDMSSLEEVSHMEQVTNPSKVEFDDVEGNKLNFMDQTWDIIQSFVRDQKNPFTEHQISSFNDFLANPGNNMITKIICEEKQHNPQVMYVDINPETKEPNLEYQIKFTKVYVGKPVINEINGKEKPFIPQEGRLRNFTYCSSIFVDVEHQIRKKDSENKWGEPSKASVNKIMIGRVPVMVGSDICVTAERGAESRSDLGECKVDQLGYFIINGNERTLVGHERMADNKPLVFFNKNGKFSSQCDVKSVNDCRYNIPKTTSIKLYVKDTTGIGLGRTIKVTIQGLKNDVPLYILMKALGVNTDKEFIKMCVYDLNDHDMIEMLKPSIEEGINSLSQNDAIKEIIKNININTFNYMSLTEEEKKNNKIKNLYDNFTYYLLPHLNQETSETTQTNFIRKAYYIGYMVNRMLSCELKRRNYDDRDHLANKKIESAGNLTAYLFCLNWRQKTLKSFVKDIKKDLPSLQGEVENIKIEKYLKPTIVDTGMKRSFAMGDWGLKQSQNNKKGVSQLLTRINTISSLSHTRRVITPIDKASKKVIGPHMLHGSHWGYLCPSETPDGPEIGINKNLSYTSTITNYTNPIMVLNTLYSLGVVPIEDFSMATDLVNNTKLFVNGVWIGIHHDPKLVYDTLIKYRRNGILHLHTGIMWNHDFSEIWVYTDSGRLIRPLYVVDNNKLRLTDKVCKKVKSGKMRWQDLLGIKTEVDLEKTDGSDTELKDNSIIEYIDVNEIENSMVATNPMDLEYNKDTNRFYHKYTHCELHQSMILGVVVNEQPFSNHNNGPRIIYCGNHFRQSAGIMATSMLKRFDTVNHMLHYPERPLICTKASRITPTRVLPSGINIVLAICCYTGYNQEDSIILNQGSMDRGLFVSTYYRKYLDEERKNHHELQEEKFEKPGKNVIQPKDNYEALDSNGFAKIGTKVMGGQVIIGKLIPIKGGRDSIQKYKDASTTMKFGDFGYVDDIKWDINGDGYKFCKVKIRNIREPTIGDKLACYDPETEIFTENRGWIKFPDLDSSDDVMSLVDGEVVYQNPIKLMKYYYEGDMYHIKNQHIDILVTPNHRVYVNSELITVETLYSMNVSVQMYSQNETFIVDAGDIIVEPYDDNVYCCTVQGLGIIYVRRNGKEVWCGNSRHAQKGTIGMILPHEDMPFNKDGITPDLIMNPHGIPSRMTIGHLIETAMGKACAIKGCYGDATSFNGFDVNELCKILGTPVEEGGCGFTETTNGEDGYPMGYSNEVLYNGMTGEQLKVRIFQGITYYQRLKQMVADKMYSRSTGPITMHTRQPSEGRAREGGLRLGEMERDSIISHGASFFLKEKLMDSSDFYKIYINRKNGMIAIGTPEQRTLKEDINDAKPVYVPYAFKLLMQELMAIGIVPRLVTN
jgi:DNA-directed RNA polymerase II subunit RPB2